MTARSSMGNSEDSPSPSMASPPTPVMARSGRRCLRPAIKLAPMRSPEASPARMKTLVIRGHQTKDRDAGSIGGGNEFGASDEQRAASLHNDCFDSRLLGQFYGSLADGWKINVEGLAGLGRLGQHKMAAPIADQTALTINAAALEQFVGAADVLGGHHTAARHDQGLPQIERSSLPCDAEGELGGAAQIAFQGYGPDLPFGREKIGD